MGIIRDVLDLMFRRVLPVPMTRWQVENRLAGMAAVRGEKLDWRNSVVDLLKLIGMDSSLVARKVLEPRDIVDAIAGIGVAFRSLGLEVPDAILLKSHDEGIRLISLLHQKSEWIFDVSSGRLGKVIEHPDGSVWMEVEVYGIKVRWPAVKYALERGGYVWS